MSELINNREHRRNILKQLIKDLHNGGNIEDIKNRFRELIQDISPTEISEMEQELINEGMPEQEIKKLCDVHVSVFKETLDIKNHKEDEIGHPIQTLKKENREIEKVVEEINTVIDEITKDAPTRPMEELLRYWKEKHQLLLEIEKHYSRKENILFPYLEKHGISGPSSVMWAIQDDIRDHLKKITQTLDESNYLNRENIAGIIEATVRPALTAIEEMIYKEENILFPMSLETLSTEEWGEIYNQGDDIGYCLITPDKGWIPKVNENEKRHLPNGYVNFETGILSHKELNLLLNNLPIDITYVDKDDRVRYFSHGKDRIFARTKAIIGRKVQNCHPPDSVHVVNKIVEELKSGKRDTADFWLEMNNMFVYIKYFALRNDNGEYMGTIEISQNVKDIRALHGEKRILDN